MDEPTRQRRRVLLLLMSGVILMIVASGIALTAVMSLIWLRDVEVRSDGHALMELLRERPLAPLPAGEGGPDAAREGGPDAARERAPDPAREDAPDPARRDGAAADSGVAPAGGPR